MLKLKVEPGSKVVEIDNVGQRTVRTVDVVHKGGKAFTLVETPGVWSALTGKRRGGYHYPYIVNLQPGETPETVARDEAERRAKIEDAHSERVRAEAERRKDALASNPEPHTARLMTANPERDLYTFTVTDRNGDLHTVMFIEDTENRLSLERAGMVAVLVGRAASLYHPAKGSLDKPDWRKFEVQGRSHDDLVNEIICKIW